MTTQEEKFGAAWAKNCREAEALGVPMKRTLSQMEELGPVQTARRIFARRRNSDGFAALAKMGRLDLSLEALILKPAFGQFFTDEEANFALDSLMEAGFYKL